MKELIKYTSEGIIINNLLIPLEEVIEKVNIEKVKSLKLGLLKIKVFRRAKDIYEYIVLPINTLKKINKLLLNKEIYFGEIEGKHSEVIVDLSEENFEIITGLEQVVSFLNKNPDRHSYNHSFTSAFYI